jgi:hypothetical protein
MPISQQDHDFLVEELQSGTMSPEEEDQAMDLIEEFRASQQEQEEPVSAGDAARQRIEENFQSPGRKLATGSLGVLEGVGSVIDFALTPVTGAAFLAGKAVGLVDEDRKFFGDEGFADISGRVAEENDATLAALGMVELTEDEQKWMDRGNLVGGLIGGVGPVKQGATAAGALVKTVGLKRIGNAFQGYGRFWGAQPGMQAAALGTGEGARTAMEVMGGDANAQLAASVIGSFSPLAAKGLLRKVSGSSKEGRKALADADLVDDIIMEANKSTAATGRLASLGLGTVEETRRGTKVLRLDPEGIISRVLRSTPGAKAVLNKAATGLAANIQAALRSGAITAKGRGLPGADKVPDLATVSRWTADQMAESYKQFKKKSARLHDTLDKAIGDHNQLVVPKQLMREVETLLVPGQEGARSGALKQLAAILDNGNPITYAQFKQARAMIGKMLNDQGASPLDRQTLMRLYGHMQDDLRSALPTWRKNFQQPTFSAGEQAAIKFSSDLGLDALTSKATDKEIITALRIKAGVDMAAKGSAKDVQRTYARQVRMAREGIKAREEAIAAQKLRADMESLDIKNLNKRENAILIAGKQAEDHFVEGRHLYDVELGFMPKTGVSNPQIIEDLLRRAETSPSEVESFMKTLRNSFEGIDEILLEQGVARAVLNDAGTGSKLMRSSDFWKEMDNARKLAEKASPAAAENAVKNLQTYVVDWLGTSGGKTGFDLKAFANRWYGLHKDARKALFEGNEGAREALDKLADLARREVLAKEAGKQVSDVIVGLSSIGAAAGTGVTAGVLSGGGVAPAALGVAIMLGGTAGAGKLLTNKAFARWLLRAHTGGWPIATSLARLGELAKDNPDIAEELDEMARALRLVSEAEDK